MKAKISFELLMEDFIQAVNKYNDLNGIAYDYGNGILLHPSEIHALRAIQSSDKPNITDVAEKLGVTKSAASQIIRKLADKGMVEKYQVSGNAKEILIRPTAQGLGALEGFQRMRRAIFSELLAEFDLMTQDQLFFLDSFFKLVDAHFDKVIRERRK